MAVQKAVARYVRARIETRAVLLASTTCDRRPLRAGADRNMLNYHDEFQMDGRPLRAGADRNGVVVRNE